MECVHTCPGQAIRGVNWRAGCAREDIYDADVCRETARAKAALIGVDETICGICIGVCPWTKRWAQAFSAPWLNGNGGPLG